MVGRAETLLVFIVGTFALFIGVQVATRPIQHATALVPSLDPAASPAATAHSHADLASTVMRSTSMPPPARDLDDIHARIAAATGSYLPDLLDAANGKLVRWPDRTMEPLRVWMQPAPGVSRWDPRFAQLARDAFTDWLTGTLPLRFDFVLDSATSDIHVAWVDRFPASRGLQVGYTQRATDQYGWIAAANIVVALHDSTGAALTPSELAGVVRHEVGHALGLGHSRNPETLMFPSERVTDIRAADRTTLRLIYSLPPGSAR